ncbi:MAG TPA: ABC transporter family substrate-binding protein [Acidimicrobiales bacterium]|nr:ABC transporter family substrate-binding protein [Acidimicrobiales bacterium]
MLHRKGPKTWLFVLLATLSLVAAACGGDDGGDGGAGQTTAEEEVVKGGSITYASEQQVGGFNTNTSKDNKAALQWIVINVYPQAFRSLPDFTVVPDENLLESAEQTKEEPQTIVYKIKREAVWSDGTPITARDFEYRWKNSNGTNKDIDIDSTTGYEDIESVTGSGSDNKTVTVVFRKPFVDWKALFTNLYPAHIMETTPGGWNEGLANPPTWSGGPFKIQSYTKDQSLTLVPNERWWGPKPNLDSILVRFGIASTNVPQALQNREIDLAYPQPQIDLVEQVKGIPGIKSEINYGLQYEHIDFNFKNEHLAVKEVRQAIAWGLDRDDIVNRTVKQFDDRGRRLDNRIWLTGQPEYEAHGKDYAKKDVAKAKAALEKAGYTAGPDGIYTKGGKKLSLRISTTGGNALREQTEQLIQAQLKDVGIDITIANVPGSAVFDEIDAGNFDIALFAWVGTPFPVSSAKSIFAPGGGQNYGKYENARLTDLFDQAIATADHDESVRISQEIDEIIWDDLATIPLFAKPTFLPYRDTYGNIKDNATTEGPLWNGVQIGRKSAA